MLIALYKWEHTGVLVYVSCVCRRFYLAVSAGRKQQQITEQLLMNHFIFTAIDHQLPHLLTHNTQKVLTENNRIHITLCAQDAQEDVLLS